MASPLPSPGGGHLAREARYAVLLTAGISLWNMGVGYLAGLALWSAVQREWKRVQQETAGADAPAAGKQRARRARVGMPARCGGPLVMAAVRPTRPRRGTK